MNRTKQYGFIICNGCQRLLRKKGATHKMCKACRKYKLNHAYGDRENIYNDKVTWKIKKPGTISRYTFYRWKKEKKI